MPGRKADPMAAYRMQVHETNHYLYAATVTTEYKNGKRIRRYTHWGTLSRELVFLPNLKFVKMPQDVRESFIYPPEWDITEVKKLDETDAFREEETIGDKLPEALTEGADDYAGQGRDGQDEGLLCGSVWFLERLAEKSHLTEDLLSVFGNDQGMAFNVLSVAMHSCLTGRNHDSLIHAQRITKYPADRILSPAFIERLLHRITDQNRMDLCKARISRLSDQMIAFNSTVHSSWGREVAERLYGSHRNIRDMEYSSQVVGYAMETKEPAYHRSFTGELSGGQVIRQAGEEMKRLGAKSPVYLMNAGFEKKGVADELTGVDVATFSLCEAGDRGVAKCLSKIRFDEFGLPLNMKYDGKRKLFYETFQADGKRASGEKANSDDVWYVLFLNPVKRPMELIALNEAIREEREMLEEQKKNGFRNVEAGLNKSLKYHKLVADDAEAGKKSVTIVENGRAVRNASSECGFFAYEVRNGALDGRQILDACELRARQERFFEAKQEQLDYRIRDDEIEEGKAGREFVVFLAMILEAMVQSLWEGSKELKAYYKTAHGILDEMADIRVIVGKDGQEWLSKFRPEQVRICKLAGVHFS